MGNVLMSVRLDGEVSLEKAAEKLGVERSQIDEEYGLVAIDADAKLFALMVKESAITESSSGLGDSSNDYPGPFSNPVIAPFGPFERDQSKN
ncbi:MAG: hypothetical protein AAFX04_12625 [Pseudomonadota bacterium]